LLAVLGACSVLAGASLGAFRLLAFHRTTSASLPPGQEPANAEKLRPALPQPDPIVEPRSQDEHATSEPKTPAKRPPIGYLTIDAIPWAHVKINGRYIRDTPIADYAVKEGSVMIELENPQLGKRRVRRFVKAGAREWVRERFE
jgi:hypothetical protein